MTRIDFMVELEKALDGFPKETVDGTLAYYSEMLADRIEDGADEAEAVASVGTVDEIRNSILEEMPVRKIVKQTVRAKQKLSIAVIILLIFAAPVWLPLAIMFLTVILCVYVCFWAVIAALWAIELGLAAGGILGIGMAVAELINANPYQMLYCLGTGLAGIALAVFLYYVFRIATRALFVAGRAVVTGIKYAVIKRRNKK